MWPFKRKATQKHRTVRAFNAAEISRLTSSWNGSNHSIDRDLVNTLPTLRGRSRDLCANNEYAKRFIHQCKVNIVGAQGITLQNRSRENSGQLDRPANNAIETAWKTWSSRGNCDVTGKLTRADIERLIVETVARDGEILIRKVPGYKNSSKYALQVIEADYLDHKANEERSNGRTVMGVDLDMWGKPVSYRILTKHPGDRVATQNREHKVIPAEEILHLYVPMRAHQTRGVPWMHAAMVSLWDVGGYREAAIVAARVGAAKMGFFMSPTGEEYTGDDKDAAGNIITEAQPGTFDQLPEGTTLESWDPTYPHDQFESFNKAMLRGIAGGLGVAYHSFANDLEGVNFSSARAGILEERDTWMMLQEWLITGFNSQIYPEWLKGSLMRGQILLPNGKPLPREKFSKFNSATWQARRWSWVDPLKDIQANREAIAQRVRSISSVIRETGNDPDDVFDEIQQERMKLEEMGIEPESLTANSDPMETDPNEEETATAQQ
jgi:lambda family phage portal protein